MKRLSKMLLCLCVLSLPLASQTPTVSSVTVEAPGTLSMTAKPVQAISVIHWSDGTVGVSPVNVAGLSVLSAPDSGRARMALGVPFVVQVMDVSGRPGAVATAELYLTKARGPGVLAGTLHVSTNTQGRGTFANVRLSQPGVYTFLVTIKTSQGPRNVTTAPVTVR